MWIVLPFLMVIMPNASRMFTIGKTTPQKEKLVRVAKECLEIGMEAAKPFGFVGDIGHAIEKHAQKKWILSSA